MSPMLDDRSRMHAQSSVLVARAGGASVESCCQKCMARARTPFKIKRLSVSSTHQMSMIGVVCGGSWQGGA
eukprot:2157735-Prymnesium_polylepis.1